MRVSETNVSLGSPFASGIMAREMTVRNVLHQSPAVDVVVDVEPVNGSNIHTHTHTCRDMCVCPFARVALSASGLGSQYMNDGRRLWLAKWCSVSGFFSPLLKACVEQWCLRTLMFDVCW